jgi:hypothetical protein
LSFFLFGIRWWSCSVLDEELLHERLVLSYCKIDRSLASALIHDVQVASKLQQVLEHVCFVRFYCVVQRSLTIFVN